MAAPTAISPQKRILEELTVICQRLDDYLNSSPSEQQCFITRKVIAESPENSPLYSMAESLAADPKAIKDNINNAVLPVLGCLREFIDVYSRPDSNFEGFDDVIADLYLLIHGARCYVK